MSFWNITGCPQAEFPYHFSSGQMEKARWKHHIDTKRASMRPGLCSKSRRKSDKLCGRGLSPLPKPEMGEISCTMSFH